MSIGIGLLNNRVLIIVGDARSSVKARAPRVSKAVEMGL